MKIQVVGSDNPLPGRSSNPIEKPHKEKCYGEKKRPGGSAGIS